MAQIVWAPSALADLESLILYISRQAPLTARRFAQKVVARVEQLRSHPLSGSCIEEDDRGIYRQLLQGNYRVIYRYSESESTVYVVSVYHAARLLDPEDLA